MRRFKDREEAAGWLLTSAEGLKLTGSELEVLRSYKETGSELNRSIREVNSIVELDSSILEQIFVLDRAIGATCLPDAVTAYQGIKRFKGIEFLQPGSIMRTPAYTSLSLLEARAQSLRGLNDLPKYLVEYRFLPDAKVLPLDGYSIANQ